MAVDTETNGLARERCELTEVGAVLVGGGELHDRWASLVGVSAPLSRGIQRFTGISQAMADAAPPPEAVLPELAAAPARARAGGALGALRRQRPAPGVHPRRARLARAAGAVHDRAGAPVRARCSAGAGWPRSRTRWGSRSPRPTGRCPTPRPARACSARSSAACAPTPRPSGRRCACSGPRRATARQAAPARAPPAVRAARPLEPAARPRRLRVPRREWAPALRRQVDLAAHPRAFALHDPVGVDRAGRARRLRGDATPSSGRSCSRTG